VSTGSRETSLPLTKLPMVVVVASGLPRGLTHTSLESRQGNIMASQNRHRALQHCSYALPSCSVLRCELYRLPFGTVLRNVVWWPYSSSSGRRGYVNDSIWFLVTVVVVAVVVAFLVCISRLEEGTYTGITEPAACAVIAYNEHGAQLYSQSHIDSNRLTETGGHVTLHWQT
jgi:hypothetical protein